MAPPVTCRCRNPPHLRKRNLSSGDLIADRRAAYAEALAEAGDFAAAAELIEQALELVPDWTAGWSLLGAYRERADNLAGAIAAWQRLKTMDPEGIFGAGLKLAAHGVATVPAITASAFVAALFDDYADRFETQLLQKLRYAVPEELASLVLAELGRRNLDRLAHAIDLGCGTGLMGERLRRHVSFLEGVDLSAGMIEACGRKSIYDALAQAELTAFLGGHAGAVDLVTAADVLNYCGELSPVLAAAARVLAPGGLIALSLEAHRGPEPIVLRPSLRYAHEPDAARRAFREAGLDLLSFEPAVLRHDRGAPVVGYLVLATRPHSDAALPLVSDDDVSDADAPAPLRLN